MPVSINHRHAKIFASVILVLVLAGCAQVSIQSTVTAEGTIEEYQMQINTTRTVYGLLEQSAEDDGYESLRDSMLSDVDDSRAEEIEYDEDFQGDEVTITITATDFEPGPDSSISITEQDGQLTYEDTTFLNETAQQEGEMSNLSRSITASMAVDYYLTMPGEIVDSNADEVDGNTAEWHESGADAFNDNRIYARSEIPTGVSVPGFGLLTAVSALLVIIGIGVIRQQRM